MARLFWTKPGLKDLEDITAFIAKDSPSYAKRFGQRLKQAPKDLKRFPRLGSIVPEYEREDLREIQVESYRVIYEVRDEDIHIVAIVHAARDLRKACRPAE